MDEDEETTLEEKFERAQEVIRKLSEAKEALNDEQRTQLNLAKEFLGDLAEADVKLQDLDIKLQQYTQNRTEGLGVKAAEIEKTKEDIKEMEKLANFSKTIESEIQNALVKANQMVENVARIQGETVQAAANTTQSTTTASGEAVKTFGRSVEATGIAAKEILKQFGDINDKIPLLAAAFAGGINLEKPLRLIKDSAAEFDKFDASINRIILTQEGFASNLVASSANIEEFKKKFPDAAKELESLGGLLQGAGLRSEDFKDVLSSLLDEGVLFNAALVSGNEASTASTVNLFAALKQLGVPSKTLAELSTTLGAGLGFTAQESNNFTREILKLSQETGLGIKAFKNAESSLGMLQGESDNVAESFKELLIVQAATGIETEKLINKFGKFKNVDEAAQITQKLNALLGDTVFDFQEIVDTPIEDRFKVLSEQLRSANMDFNDLGFQTRSAIAEILGFEVGETAILLGDRALENYGKISEGVTGLAASNKELEVILEQGKDLNQKITDGIQEKAIPAGVQLSDKIRIAGTDLKNILGSAFEMLEGKREFRDDPLALLMGGVGGAEFLMKNLTKIEKFAKERTTAAATDLVASLAGTALLSETEIVEKTGGGIEAVGQALVNVDDPTTAAGKAAALVEAADLSGFMGQFGESFVDAFESIKNIVNVDVNVDAEIDGTKLDVKTRNIAKDVYQELKKKEQRAQSTR